ncbi:MAG: polyphosphate kinase 1 [Candidatus Riflebacteria bacterium HGW-Riflebacteria-1]|jgi:polyphosphate kinase|nr:MAG: polyphosphate kinase 1 [Candidatus Riflebacteria bacterium HGW-Riflebacteria-1]
MKNRRYLNRELSWLEFNSRVLEQAAPKDTPLLERLKFLSIFSSNLDEFFMVRVAGVMSQIRLDYREKYLSGHRPEEIFALLNKKIRKLVDYEYKILNKEILPALQNEGVFFYTATSLPEAFAIDIREKFLKKFLMILTPMAVDQARPFPFIPGKTLNILAELSSPQHDQPLYAVVPVPGRERFYEISPNNYIYSEELVRIFLKDLFEGYTLEKSCVFRIIRDAELSFDEEEARDLLSAIESELRTRDRGYPVRLEVEKNAAPEMVAFLHERFELADNLTYYTEGPLNVSAFMEFYGLYDNAKLRDARIVPVMPIEFAGRQSTFAIIAAGDRILNLPYESFSPVEKFVEEASKDPSVLAIKQTLYRTSGNSPIIKSLKRAAQNGKQVTVVVELKARFDEAQNISWAKQLEESGCHVSYGLVGLKTHCKMTLVVREEARGIKRYAHLSTGNYNDKTARLYTDVGFFSCRNSFAADIAGVFNYLTGYCEPPRRKKIISAPFDLRQFLLDKIAQETRNAQAGLRAEVVAKMNSLVDPDLINALYEASGAGVKVTLIVRGICCLNPGVPRQSENIKVFSIVDRFLEHSRIFYFYNNKNHDLYLSSADWMMRNLDRRVEILFPVEDDAIKKEILHHLEIQRSDNTTLWEMLRDGEYRRRRPGKGDRIRSQLVLAEYEAERNMVERIQKTSLKKRKSPFKKRED